MKFLVLAAFCLSVAVAGPTRNILMPDNTGPIIENEDIDLNPAIIPENISNGPALIEKVEQQSSFLRLVININAKTHIIEIPVEDAIVPEEIIKPDHVHIVDSVNVGTPDIPLLPSPVDISTPHLPGLDAE